MKNKQHGQKIAILVNSRARRGRNQQITHETARDLLHRDVTVYATGSLEELHDAVSRILAEGFDLLGISGGDGTVHLLLTEMLNQGGDFASYPDLLILRGGTMNMAAANLGTRHPPLLELRTLQLALTLEQEKGFTIPVKQTRPLCVNGPDRPLYGFVFAAGIPPRILQEYYKGDPSPARAANVTASIMLESFLSRRGDSRYFAFQKAGIVLDGKPYDAPAYKVIVATPIPKLLLWFDVFDNPRGPLTRGFYCLINSMKTKDIARNVWALSRGRYHGPGHINSIFHKMEIDRPVLFTLDGEVYEENKNGKGLTISSGPLLNFLDLSGIHVSGLLAGSWHYEQTMERPIP